MTKKPVIFFAQLAFYLFASSYCYSQGSVSGRITDVKGMPLDQASVLLLQSNDSTLVRGIITSNTGSYLFDKLSPGDYMVNCSYAGLKTAYTSVFHIRKDEQFDLGALVLTAQDNLLADVTVTATKPLFEQKIDRMIINVASSITNAGSTVLDVLMRSPGIMVNQQNNTLSMNGKEGVFVMINGKLSRMPMDALVQLLAGMSSANIERIELITTPPANFDAEGNAGFINIVLKENLDYGTNGSFAATLGYGIGAGPMGTGSINFNHRKKRWNFYGDYSFSRISLNTYGEFIRKIANGNKLTDNFAITERDDYRRNHNARLGIDYEITRNTTVGILLSTFSNMYGMDAVNTSRISLNGLLDTIISIDQFERHPLDNFGTNLNVQHKFKQQQQLSVNIDHIIFRQANRLTYFNKFYDGNSSFLFDDYMRSSKQTPIQFSVASTDYSQKIGTKVDMELGAKATVSNFVNDVRVENLIQDEWVTAQDFTSNHTLQESILAAYASFNFRISEKTTSKIGLRYEYTNSNLGSELVKNIVDRKYGNLFPSIFLSHQLAEHSSFNFAYSRRITRPTFNDMAPFVYFVDPNTFISGNPALQPAISNSVKWDYLLHRFVFSLSYTYEKGTITIFSPKVDAQSNKQTFNAENQPSKHIAALNVTIPLTITGWWRMQTNFTGQLQHLNAIYQNEPLTIRQQNFAVNTTQTFTLPKAYSIEVSGAYMSGGMVGMFRMDPIISFDLGVQRKFGAKGGALSLNVTDFTGPPTNHFSVNAPEHNLVTNLNLRFRVSTIKLTYSRKFGNVKVKEKRDRSTGAEDERRRVISN